MDDNKVRVVIYEKPERIKLVDELALQEEVSRSELYRRAMRLLLSRHYSEDQSDDDT